MRSSIVPVGGEDKVFPVKGKHGKSIEDRVEGDLLQPSTIYINHKQVKLVTSF